MKRLWTWLRRSALALLRWGALTGILIASLTAFGLAWIAVGSWRYAQQDDRERVERKEAYLAEVARSAPDASARRPNVVLILFDDLGYGDLGAYGSRSIATPELDRMAAEGVRLTDYYSPAPVCSPARAGLLTGRYPVRTRLTQVPMTPDGTSDGPMSGRPQMYQLQRAAGEPTRLPLEEITLAEVLQAAGYATGMFGKWHLGAVAPSLPNDRGFQVFHGLLSSNDQLPNPFYNDRQVVEPSPVDQTTLTERYTLGALEFIETHGDEPFFLYLPHTFPHRPLYPSSEQRGRSQGGLYGDVVEDLDRSVGRILKALRRRGLAENTLVLATSDNGPWFQGSPGLQRGRKTDLFDGGFAVPFLAWWPGTLPAGAVRTEMAMGIDVFPTVLSLAGIPLPEDRVVDGRDMLPLLRDGAPSAHQALYFYWNRTLGAVREGRFKYHARRPILLGVGPAWMVPQIPMGPWLFDVVRDSDESYDVSHRHPEVASRLAALLDRRREADRDDVRGFRQVGGP